MLVTLAAIVFLLITAPFWMSIVGEILGFLGPIIGFIIVIGIILILIV
jgi:hypothetical protein